MLNTKQSHSSITSAIFYTYNYSHKKRVNQLEFGTCYSTLKALIYFLEKT